MNVHNTEIFCSPPATGHGSKKLSPYLGEEVVKRMMVHVAGAVEKSLKSVMFPTRDTAGVTVSSNCYGHSRCEGTFGVPWDRKDPNCTSVCKGSWSVCLCSMPGRHATSILLQQPQKENCLDCPRGSRRLNFPDVTVSGPATVMVTLATSNGC